MKIIDYFKKKIIKKRKLFFIKTELDKLPKNNYPFGLNKKILEDTCKKYLDNPKLVPNISYPKIDILLKKLFKKKEKIYFLDIGAQFIDNYLFLSKKNKNLEYFYFDQKINNKIVDRFSKIKKLKRFKSLMKIQDIKKYKINFVYFGSVIQYMNDYNEVINLISKKKPKFIFFSGTSLYKNLKKNRFVVRQVNVWPQINYCFFFQYKYFFKLLEQRNYKLVFKKNNLNDRVINYSNISKSLNIKINYTDLLFKFNG